MDSAGLLGLDSAGGQARVWHLGASPYGFSLTHDMGSLWLGLVTAWRSQGSPPSSKSEEADTAITPEG